MARIAPRIIASVLGRSQAPEYFTSIPFAAGQSPTAGRTFNLTRPLTDLHLVLRLRVKPKTASFLSLASEAPQTLLQRLRVTGTHRVWSNLTMIDQPGPQVFAWPGLFGPRGGSVYMATNGGTPVRLPDLSTPIQALVAGTTFGKNGDTYDLEIHYHIPVNPVLAFQNRAHVAPYYWYPQDFADTIQIQPTFGDASSVGPLTGGADCDFTDYGANTGNGTLDIYASYSILSQLANYVKSAVVVRSSAQVTAPVASVATKALLYTLQKQKTTNIILKAGTYIDPAASDPGVQVFGALSDSLLEQTQVWIDNKPIRNNQRNSTQKEFISRAFGTNIPQGYIPFSFIDSHQTLTMFRGDKLPPGSQFTIVSDVTDNDNFQACEIIQEQIYGDPDITLESPGA